MKKLLNPVVRIFICLAATAVVAETLNIIAGKPSQAVVDHNNQIGLVSGILLFVVLMYFVKQYKKNI